MNVCQRPILISVTARLARTVRCQNWPDIGDCGLVPGRDMLLYCAIKGTDWGLVTSSVYWGCFSLYYCIPEYKIHALHNEVPRLCMCRAKPQFPVYLREVLLNWTLRNFPLCAIIIPLSILSVCLQVTVTVRMALNVTEYCDLKEFGGVWGEFGFGLGLVIYL